MNSKLFDKKLGIIGGGQLGKMLLAECNKMSIKTHVIDSSERSPCKNLCSQFYFGDLNDYDTILNFGRECDIITFEIEHINVDALDELEKMGKDVYPRPSTLRIIQDKNQQKRFFKNNNIPTSDFKYFKCLEDLAIAIDKNEINFPCVWKKTKFGYDGFGVKVLKSPVDIETLPDSEMIIEEFIPFDKELSVIVARNPSGEVKCYKTVEMEFNKDSNQVEYVISPANISDQIDKKAQDLAIKLSNSLDSIGILAVEMFLTNNSILVNELAPRPHNSGHFSIEACQSSQFQQHIRAVFNLKLGETNHLGSAIMLNIVGSEGYSGKVYYENLDHVFKSKFSNLHLYGKEETRPNRKMGHVTIICDKFEDSYEKAKFLKETIKVKSK
jgi:5-(carboxyamino)imidazole ribonucleotide synthase